MLLLLYPLFSILQTFPVCLPAAASCLWLPSSRVSACCRLVSLLPSPRASARRRPAPLPAAAPCLCLLPPRAFARCRLVPLAAVVRTLHASPQCAKINTAVFSVRSAAQPSVSGADAAAGWFANGPSDRPSAGNPRTQVLLAGHARAGRFGLAPRKGLSFPYFSHRKEGIL